MMATDIPPSRKDPSAKLEPRENSPVTPPTPEQLRRQAKETATLPLTQEEDGERLMQGSLRKLSVSQETPAERQQRGREFIESLNKPIVPTPEQERKVDYLIFLQDVVRAVKKDPVAFRTDDMKTANITPAWGNTPTEGAKLENEDEYRGAVASRADGFLAKSVNLTMDIMMNNNFGPVSALGNDLYWLVKGLGFEKMPKDQQELLEYRNRFVSMLRERKKYDDAEHQITYALKDEFAEHVEHMKNIPSIHQAAETKASDEVKEMIAGVVDTWRAQGMSDAQIIDVQNQFIRISKERILCRKAFQYREFNVSGTKAELAEQYNNMLDPKNEANNMSDKNWDLLMEAVLVNIPLVVFTGFVGMAARAGVSFIAREFFVNMGEVFVGRFAAAGALESAGMRVAGGVAGYSIESSVASSCFRLFKKQWYQGLAGFAADLIFSLVARGVINTGAMSLKGGLISPPGYKAINAMRETAAAIENQPLKSAVDRLIETDNMVGAGVVLTQAAEHGMISGLGKKIRDKAIKEILEFLGDAAEETTKLQVVPGGNKMAPHLT